MTPRGLGQSFAVEFLKAGGDLLSWEKILGYANLDVSRAVSRRPRLILGSMKKARPATRLLQCTNTLIEL
ncbi:MAG: hypothetical protein ACPLPR_02080 [Bacillota bacterium]